MSQSIQAVQEGLVIVGEDIEVVRGLSDKGREVIVDELRVVEKLFVGEIDELAVAEIIGVLRQGEFRRVGHDLSSIKSAHHIGHDFPEGIYIERSMVSETMFDAGRMRHFDAVEPHHVDGAAFVVIRKAAGRKDAHAGIMGADVEGLVLFVRDRPSVTGMIEFGRDAGSRIFFHRGKIVPGRFGDEEDAEGKSNR